MKPEILDRSIANAFPSGLNESLQLSTRTAAAQLRLPSWRVELIWYNHHGRTEVVDGAAGCIEIVDLSVCDLHVAGP